MMGRRIWIMVVMAMFLMLPFSSMVRADVVEQERTLHIEANPDTPYSSVLNVINASRNNQFLNTQLLVKPFIENTSINGGYSGSLLPPAKFQLNGANASQSNANLVLASMVRFQRKNMLSGASESWWRCPYYWNYSVSASRNWNCKMSIYKVDLPRTVNLTYPYLSTLGTNADTLPNGQSHGSLVFRKYFTNCGQTNSSYQRWIHHAVDIPVNDTWNETSGDYEYKKRYEYSFTWFNVSAPIYPNQTYLVVYDIGDLAIGVNDACSMWITATDIGDDEFYRTMFSWSATSSGFNGTTYEIPIDLDCSVIFRLGMDAGVTGTKLEYNNPSYTDMTGGLTSQSFEDDNDGSFDDDFQDHFTNHNYWFSGWNGVGVWGIDGWDWVDASHENFQTNFTALGTQGICWDTGINNLLYANYPYITRPATTNKYQDGINSRIKVSFKDCDTYTDVNNSLANPNYVHANSVFVYVLQQSDGLLVANTFEMYISRFEYVDYIGKPNYQHELIYNTGGGVYNKLTLPTLPNDIIVAIDTIPLTLYAGASISITIYDSNNPYTPIYHNILTETNSLASANTIIRIGGGIYYERISGMVDKGYPIQSQNFSSLSVDKTTYCSRDVDSAWSRNMAFANQRVHRTNLQDGYETGVINYNPSPVYERNTFGIEQNYLVGTTYEVFWQQFAVPTGSYRYSASMYYQLRSNQVLNPNYRVSLVLQGRLTGVGTWQSLTQTESAVDSAWHRVATPMLNGNYDRLNVSFIVYFGSTLPTSSDFRMVYIDNITVDRITGSTLKEYLCYQQVDRTEWNSTNYYTLLLPFKHNIAPDYPVLASVGYYNSAGTLRYFQYGTPADWFDDYLIISTRTSLIPSDVVSARIRFVNFGEETYIFLQDRNSDGYLNTNNSYNYNYLWEYDTGSPTVIINETWFSPYYSLGTTEGRWTNADGMFTTTYFYYVNVRFVGFNDTDAEMLDVKMYSVDLGDFQVFRLKMQQFGEVLTTKEWLSYLEVRNPPDFFMISDSYSDFAEWLINRPIGQFFLAIGKFVYDGLVFLADALSWFASVFIEGLQFVIAVLVFYLVTWVYWKFVKFWNLFGEGRTNEGLNEMKMTSDTILSYIIMFVVIISSIIPFI